MQGEPRLPREAGLPAPRDYPLLHANTCRSHLWAVVFQGFAFLNDLGNILEQLNIALEAVPFTCLCSFNKHPLRACSEPDAPVVKRHRRRLGSKAVPGPPRRRPDRVGGGGGARRDTGGQVLSGRGPGAAGTDRRGTCPAREVFPEEDSLMGTAGVCRGQAAAGRGCEANAALERGADWV